MLLLGLEGVAVERVAPVGGGARVVHVATADESAAACPGCGVISASVKEYPTTRPKDLPYGPDPVLVRWHKRRWCCTEPRCGRTSFTEAIAEVPPGARGPRAGCGGRVRTRWATIAARARSLCRIGCPGLQCSARWMRGRTSSWASLHRLACWGSMRALSVGLGGSATARPARGGARIHSKPDSSTWPAGRG